MERETWIKRECGTSEGLVREKDDLPVAGRGVKCWRVAAKEVPKATRWVIPQDGSHNSARGAPVAHPWRTRG